MRRIWRFTKRNAVAGAAQIGTYSTKNALYNGELRLLRQFPKSLWTNFEKMRPLGSCESQKVVWGKRA